MATTPAEIRQQFVDWGVATSTHQYDLATKIGQDIALIWCDNYGYLHVTESPDGPVFQWTGGEIANVSLDVVNALYMFERKGISLPWTVASALGNVNGETRAFLTRIDGDDLEAQWELPAKEEA